MSSFFYVKGIQMWFPEMTHVPSAEIEKNIV